MLAERSLVYSLSIKDGGAKFVGDFKGILDIIVRQAKEAQSQLQLGGGSGSRDGGGQGGTRGPATPKDNFSKLAEQATTLLAREEARQIKNAEKAAEKKVAIAKADFMADVRRETE